MRGLAANLARLTLLLVLVGAGGPSGASAAVFQVRPGGDSKVVFISKAPMERFEGKTGRLEGTIDVDPAQLGDSATVHFEVDMASLDTGIAKRNQHMRENHLETAKYPKAVFDGAAIHAAGGASLATGKATTLDVEGAFTLHGVTRRIRIPVEVTYKRGAISFKTTFRVSLADYAISLPQFLFLKLADTQEVRVSGTAVSAP
ncbi:MAG TPA: YceI family protein [Candidatus Limnocylindrales bacterium]|nr:YceI family protein [Candidatus Limnocylindrales bacterium]